MRNLYPITKCIFLLLLILLSVQKIIAQNPEANTIIGIESAIKNKHLNMQFSDYKLYQIDINEIRELLSYDNYIEIGIQLGNIRFAELMERRVFIDSNTNIKLIGEYGLVDYEQVNFQKLQRTYRGFENGKNRMSVNTDFFNLSFEFEDSYYHLEQLKTYQKDANADLFILYTDKDVNNQHGFQCVTQFNDYIKTDDKASQKNSDVDNCIEIEISLAIDYAMYQDFGENQDNVLNHLFSLLNGVEGLYHQFNAEFKVIQTATETANYQTWGNTIDGSTMLNNIGNWGEQNFTEIFDVVTLWTGIDLYGYSNGDYVDIAGIANFEGVCNSLRYNIVENFSSNTSSLRVAWAHEIGHNLNAPHDSGSGYVMTASVYPSATGFSSQSVDIINNYINSSSGWCIEECTGGGDEDIFITNASLSSTNVSCGSEITMSCTQNYSGNQLDTNLPTFDLDYYLSTNTTLGNSDILIGSDGSGLGSDDPSNNESDSGIIPADTPAGTYYILFVSDADNELSETNENNNIEYIQIQVSCGGGNEDIFLTNISVSSTNVSCGSNITMSCTQNYSGNQPDSNLPSFDLDYYLSTNTTFGNSDVLLAGDSSGLGSDDTSNNETATAAIPADTPSGTYYILFVADADDELSETNENNNVEYIQIQVTCGGNDDIFLTNVSVSPTNAACGTEVTMSCTQNYSGNQLDTNLPTFDLDYYLSTNTILDNSDILLADDGSGLGSDDPSNDENATVLIPSNISSGTYYILFVADAEDELSETNENNNIEYIQIQIECNEEEDIFLTNPSVSNTNPNCGDDIILSCTQNYSGNQPDANLPSFNLAYYLSTNIILDNADIFLTYDVSGIGSDDTSEDETGTGTIPADTPPGTYYILFVADADDELSESNENNNIEYIQIQVSCAPTTYTVSVAASPTNGGTVAGGGMYTAGSNATVTASANSNWTFTNWTQNGAVITNAPSYTFEVTSNRSLVANFAYTSPPPSACRQSDSLALVALYQSTNGTNWGITWQLAQAISTWHGITLNAEGCVTHINLNQNNLVGTIPPEIGNLSALIRLNMHSNQLSGSIPATIGNLSELRQIWLFSNQLSGQLPPEIGNLSNLTHLGIGGNQLTGTIPASYGNLSNLGFFTVKNNQLSGCFDENLLNICGVANDGQINTGNNFSTTWSTFCATGDGGCMPPPPPPSTCRYMDSLVLIQLYQSTNGVNWNTVWNTAMPIHMWHGITLNADGCVEEINLPNNNLTGIIPPAIGELAALTRLNMHTNNLSGSIPSTIGNLSELRQIWLFKNQLSGELPPEIGNLNKLTHFGVGANELTGTISGTYGNLSSLGFFTIPHNNLSGCFDENLLNICDAAGNANINSGNNFDALWSDFCANGTGSCSPPPPPTNCSTDSLIMVDLYYATNGPNWTTTWNLSDPMSMWHGVTLNVDGCVLEINLPNNNLVGTLPASIGGFSALTRFNLHSNQLSGSIPTSIGNVTTLEQIWLFSNQMTGTLPPEIGNLSNLTHLGIGGNQFTGSIPASYGNLSSLGFLALKNNNLSGCYDANLANICHAGTDSRVSSGNNFAASWSSFCASATGCCNCRLDMSGYEFGDDSLDGNTITLYPNPVKNTLHIAYSDDQQIQELILFDMNGKTVRTFEYPANQVDVSGMPQGIYVVKVAIESGVVYRKIVIE